MKKSRKIIFPGVFCAVLSGLIVISTFTYSTVLAEQSLADRTEVKVEDQTEQRLSSICRYIYALCRNRNDYVQHNLNSNLNVLRFILKGKGEITFSQEMIAWEAFNQYTREGIQIDLPKMMIGEEWLGQSRSAMEYALVIDDAVNLVGGTATIFQKMNSKGEMLRVATNVIKPDGTRAIGSYIPAINPDGSSNPVVSTILNGQTFKGKACIFGTWYSTAYEPLIDQNNDLVGMLYAGVKQFEPGLRETILNVKEGEPGHCFVLGGSGRIKGQYLVSRDGKMDGTSILDKKDNEGNFFIRDMIDKAVNLSGGEVMICRYPWKEEDSGRTRMKIAAVTYFEPWDWVIGVAAYEDDLSAVQD